MAWIGGDSILSHGLWQNCFGGNRSLVGQVLSLNDMSFTVIGIMPPNVDSPQFAQIWTPIRLSRTEEGRGNHSYRVVGKLQILTGTEPLAPNCRIGEAGRCVSC